LSYTNASGVGLTVATLSSVNDIGTVNGVTASGGVTLVAQNAPITLNQAVTANTTGNDIVLAGNQFINNVGAAALSTGSGNFLVWSGTPSSDTRNGLTYNFKQYNATYGVTTVLGTGNGFLYTTTPVITANLTGTVSKVYNGTTAATLAVGNYAADSGAIDGDTVTLNTPTSGTYSTRNVGTGITINSITGLSITSATNGAATVYGYQVSSTPGSANIGTITAAPLTISSNAGLTKVYGTNDPAADATAYSVTSGTVYSPDALTGSMGRAVGETVGSYNFTKNTVTVNDGNGGNNYSVTFNGSTNPFVITKASLTGSIANQSKVYGANDPAIAGITVNLGGVVNATVTDINGNNTPINDTTKVATTLASLTRTAGETVSASPYTITAATFNALTGTSAGNYNAPTFSGSPTLSITKANLTGSIANQSKVYGANDPTLSGITVTLGGVINNASISTWNGTVSINDTAKVAATLATLTRTAGETVAASPYSITAATFNALTGTSAGNYNAPTLTGSPTLSITKAALTASIANQTKVYGANDPTLSGISVTLGGVINNSSVVTWNGNVSINDTGNVVTTLASLTRTAGETVSASPYSITAATFNALTGSAIGNYTAPTSLTGSPTLSITKANLTGSIANQSKVYGANDPTLSGIAVNLTGLINNASISTWNGTASINDSALTSTVTALVRTAGELVSGSPYSITSATFSAPSGNYNAPTLTGSPTLSITKASLTASIANQTKVYGANDPTLSGITVTLGGVINNSSISTWNGTVSINDTGNVVTTLASLTRTAGETVGSSPYSITAATFNALTGSAIGNYTAPTSLTGSPTLSITKANLTGSIANQSKVYGANDPLLSGITVTLNGIVNNASISTWNGTVSINDTAKVAATLATLTRTAGETVAASPYSITGATFNALTGTSAGNYNSPTLTGSPTLSITKAALTASIANQTKVYGANDPTLSGISVTLGGVINNSSISTWNGTVSINDTGNVATTLASLTRTAGETVGSSPYSITAATFNALTGSAIGNYTAPTSLTGSPTLSITKANLTGSIANQSKVYGANDPTLSGIAVNLTGLINNASISTWNGTASINDSALTSTVTALTRTAGELVSGSPYSITSATFSAPSGNYNAPTLTGSPTLSITKASLTASIANQTKVYGANDPTLSGISVTLGGVINNPSIVTWNGNISINDTGNVVTTLASLTRTAGETVGSSPYSITAATFNALTGSAIGNYTAPTSLTGSPTLSITKANLTGSIANQSKVYGANDPTLSGITVTLNGIVNNASISTWNGTVSINDTAKVAATLATLTRTAGETVAASPYSITAATFNALTGTSAGNYNAPTLTGSPTLSITKAALTASIANQTKVYGANDPTLSGISVTLGGVINNSSISTWNGTVSINDTGNVASTLASLTRTAGETVGSSPYSITASTFNALTGSAIGNYTAPTSLTGSPTLSITKASLTASIANQTKVYGANDPTLSGITVTLGGVINNSSINTWNGTVSINDTGNVATTLASLTRTAGETVGSSPYSITAATFNALTGSAIGNYTAPTSLTGSPTLSITKANLTGSIANQSKVYGANDPTLSGIAVNLTGLINNASISTWNGTASINDSALTSTVTALIRTAGELVSGSPYSITSATFSAPSGNYNAPTLTGSPTLSITKASLTASIANQTKVYGANDPTLSGITVTLGGVINNSSISTWNGTVSINDTGNVATTLASLTRTAGETVGSSPYSITAATFNALTGSAIGNYTAPTSLTGSPTLSITKANLTGSIANQSKVYGANDPTLSGIAVNLTGLINNASISTWNGTTSINDSALTSTVTALVRTAGELVSGSPYSITSATFSAPSGNYNAPTLTGSPTLSITKASLTASIANQTKVYGANDPTLSGITVTLGGVINNPSIVTWNGNVSVNDTGNVLTTLASLTRTAGETVGSSPYSITAATFNALTGSAIANYNAPTSLTGSPTLSITKANLTGSIANQSKVYGANDPTLSGITVTLAVSLTMPRSAHGMERSASMIPPRLQQHLQLLPVQQVRLLQQAPIPSLLQHSML
jgi:DNA/RNA-binding domain of Phe-tRNA-synthetase-like protein